LGLLAFQVDEEADRLGNAPDSQRPGHDEAIAAFLETLAAESDGGELGRVEKILLLKVSVSFGAIGVHRIDLNHDRDAGLLGVLSVELQLSLKLRKPTATGPGQVADFESHGALAIIEVVALRGNRSSQRGHRKKKN